MLSINTNLASLGAQRSLNMSQSSLERSVQRLSTGLRVNGASDDAAGLAIAERMTSHVRGNTVAIRNANDGVSMLQVADGALAEITRDLQRIRDLGVQAANGTNSDSDRLAIENEITQLLENIDQTAKTTQFNGRSLFDAGSGNASNLDENEKAALLSLHTFALRASEQRIKTYYGIDGNNANLAVELRTFTDGAGNTAARVGSSVNTTTNVATQHTMQVDMADFTPPNLPNGGNAPFYNDRIIMHEMVHAVMG
ncbi:MAG: flagellin, partial [Gammaproteobacteria bacterium]|nr:flagellin [Gammaproteobacteria bacterium]